ncbi:hypothetical protein NPIL_266191 [Nephila pilipes]|uniref:Uncharacterized protein n=1 Tax=Nephila pilipes TaxID=299642 RepID=A0A8X6PGW4_NEPPI|nr:hypothetical protein NPIL_266191 [Nephila pilipes]
MFLNKEADFLFFSNAKDFGCCNGNSDKKAQLQLEGISKEQFKAKNCTKKQNNWEHFSFRTLSCFVVVMTFISKGAFNFFRVTSFISLKIPGQFLGNEHHQVYSEAIQCRLTSNFQLEK